MRLKQLSRTALRQIDSAPRSRQFGPAGGFVAKYMGDEVLVYFGYPQAHEDDAERAVRASLELIAAVAGLRTHAPLQTLAAVFELVTWWAKEGKAVNRAHRCLHLRGFSSLREPEPFGAVIQTPGPMADGNRSVAAYIDERADDKQTEALGAISPALQVGPWQCSRR
jgi:Protein of unknown function (DUF1326)